MGSRALNLGLHICTANTGPAEPFPWLQSVCVLKTGLAFSSFEGLRLHAGSEDAVYIPSTQDYTDMAQTEHSLCG